MQNYLHLNRLTNLTWTEGEKRRHMSAGRPWMLGIRVVSLAITLLPAELHAIVADTMSWSWGSVWSSSSTMEFTLFGSTSTVLSEYVAQ